MRRGKRVRLSKDRRIFKTTAKNKKSVGLGGHVRI